MDSVFSEFWYTALWGFLIFSVLGVVVEMVYAFAREGVIESRLGVLYLPLSPIYGLGGVAITAFLLPYLHDPILLFFVGIVVGTVLEYVASFVMEKLFHTIFWDYSNEPLNLHGRVCAQYSLYWGLLSLLLIYVIDPPIGRLIDAIPQPLGDRLLLAACIVAAAGIALTLAAFARLRAKVDALEAGRPVPSGALGRAIDTLAPDVVMAWTFPRMNLVQEYLQARGIEPSRVRLDLRVPSAEREAMLERARTAGQG
ncbi:hypothetical protein GGQ54_000315 [Naumannella cuiyingiana]|uniref:ABC transporter permease n=1 Tax=Naumannella cuiyingiana TaxID=1347891 RepID=A0A7Z0IJP4_9ACTN|nr:hypothetical protein [Naumannella cuiyingiana]